MIIKDIDLKQWGNSQGIRIGKEELAELGVASHVTFTMIVDGGTITLKPKKKYPQTLDELFADYNGEVFQGEEFDLGDPVGKEII